MQSYAGIASRASRREYSSLHPSNQPSPHRKEERPTVLGPYWIRQSRAVRGQTPMSTQSRCSDCRTCHDRGDIDGPAHPPTLFSLAPAIPSASSAHRLAGAARSLAVAMSALRRHHATCRAPLRRATSPPIPASSQPVRHMNPHLQPRILLVLRRAHWFCVSHLSGCSMVVRFRLSDVPPHAHSLCDPLLKPKRCDRNVKLLRANSSSNPCGREDFGNGDHDAGCPAPSQILVRRCRKTSPNKLLPGSRTLCRCRQGRHRSWPSCMAKQRSLLICAPNREGSSPPQLSCLRLNRRVPAPPRSEGRLTSESPSDIPRWLPAHCPYLRSRRRECSVETNPSGPKAGLSYLLQSGQGNPAAHSRSLIRYAPH